MFIFALDLIALHHHFPDVFPFILLFIITVVHCYRHASRLSKWASTRWSLWVNFFEHRETAMSFYLRTVLRIFWKMEYHQRNWIRQTKVEGWVDFVLIKKILWIFCWLDSEKWNTVGDHVRSWPAFTFILLILTGGLQPFLCIYIFIYSILSMSFSIVILNPWRTWGIFVVIVTLSFIVMTNFFHGWFRI